jgi:hypothetical protein
VKVLLLGLLGFLLFSPSALWAEDLFSVARHPYGAVRFTANVFGQNADNDAALESIWDGSDLAGPVRCFDVIGTAAVALYISSDDENDASDNNAVSVTVEALDANWDPVTIEAPLGVASAGGTVFAQVGTVILMRVNRAFVSSTNVALGNIYIGIDPVDSGANGIPDTVLTELVAGIVIGNNQTQQACYTVPDNYNAFLTHFCATNPDTAANAVTVFGLRSSVEGAASRAQELFTLAESTTQCFEHAPHSPPILFTQRTDIELTSESNSADAAASGSFDLVLIDNRRSGLY